MDVLSQIALKIDLVLLIMARIGGIFLIGPVFSHRLIPRQVKIFMVVVISLIMHVSLNLEYPDIPVKLGPFALYILSEMLIGLVIGFVAQLTFAAIQLAGQAMDLMLGFSIVNVVDPVYGTQAPLIGSYQNLLAILVFLATDSHHYMIAALYQSYQQIPIFGLSVGTEISQVMINLFGGMLVTGIKLGIPVAGAIFVAEVAFGIIARTIPQLQIFFVSIPAKIFLGFVLLLVILPGYLFIIHGLFEGNFQDILRVIKIMG